MNWGKGILISIISFVGVIMVLVIISVRMDGIELVTGNYYEKEIRYQERIEEESSTLARNLEVISYDEISKSIVLDLPRGANATVQLFRPSDSSLDQKIELEVSDQEDTTIPVRKLKPGYWKVQLTWSAKGVRYYEEKKITI